MTIDQLVDLYEEELENWQFFSDKQRAYVNEDGHIVVCLRNNKWYITKHEIKNIKESLKAIFEIDWIAEYDDEESKVINWSKFWTKM